MRDLPADSALARAAAAIAPQIHDMLAPLVPQSDRTTKPGELGYYEFYYALGQLLRPASFLEIGVLGGASACAVALGAGSSLRDVVLLDNESHDDGKQAVPLSTAMGRVLAANPQPMVTCHPVDSQRLSAIPSAFFSGQFNLIHVDGDHRVGPCYHDLRITWPRLELFGHLLVDDANWSWVTEAVEAFVPTLKARVPHNKVRVERVPTTSGMFILHDCHEGGCPLLWSA